MVFSFLCSLKNLKLKYISTFLPLFSVIIFYVVIVKELIIKQNIPENNINFSINKQIRITNIINTILITTTIGLFIVLFIPENNELFLFPKIYITQILFSIEVILAVIQLFIIYHFSSLGDF